MKRRWEQLGPELLRGYFQRSPKARVKHRAPGGLTEGEPDALRWAQGEAQPQPSSREDRGGLVEQRADPRAQSSPSNRTRTAGARRLDCLGRRSPSRKIGAASSSKQGILLPVAAAITRVSIHAHYHRFRQNPATYLAPSASVPARCRLSSRWRSALIARAIWLTAGIAISTKGSCLSPSPLEWKPTRTASSVAPHR